MGVFKMRKMRIYFWLPLTLVVVLCICLPLQARPSRDRVLGELLITERAEEAEVNIGFNFPIRYVRHFPETEGDELRIQMRPLQVGMADQDALFKREAITVDQDNLADITEVIYEGVEVGGLVLIVYFTKPKTFSVKQGSDYRSIQLVVKK